MGLDLSREGYAAVLEDLGLWGFPRKVGGTLYDRGEDAGEKGFPGQHLIGSPDGFFKWFEPLYGKVVPLFVAHNGLGTGPDGVGVDLASLLFRRGFGDFDTGDGSGLKPGEVWEEVQRTSRWLVERRIEHAWKYSGSDCGFHLGVFFTPETHRRSYLERWESAFWRGIKNELYLRSVNIKCANPVCLERLPFTPYVHKKDPASKEYKKEANFCVPIPWNWVHEGRLDDIRALSAAPYDVGPVRYRGAPPFTLEKLVRMLKWDAFGRELGALHPLPAFEPKGSMADWNKRAIPKRKCLQLLPFGANPRHSVRLAWVHEVIASGIASGLPYGLEELTAIVDRVAEEAQWEDRGNTTTRHDQVVYAWRKPYAVNSDGTVRGYGFSCRWLRENGVCLGPSCPLFRLQFPEDWRAYTDAHPEALLAGGSS